MSEENTKIFSLRVNKDFTPEELLNKLKDFEAKCFAFIDPKLSIEKKIEAIKMESEYRIKELDEKLKDLE